MTEAGLSLLPARLPGSVAPFVQQYGRNANTCTP